MFFLKKLEYYILHHCDTIYYGKVYILNAIYETMDDVTHNIIVIRILKFTRTFFLQGNQIFRHVEPLLEVFFVVRG